MRLGTLLLLKECSGYGLVEDNDTQYLRMFFLVVYLVDERWLLNRGDKIPGRNYISLHGLRPAIKEREIVLVTHDVCFVFLPDIANEVFLVGIGGSDRKEVTLLGGYLF